MHTYQVGPYYQEFTKKREKKNLKGIIDKIAIDVLSSKSLISNLHLSNSPRRCGILLIPQ